MRNHQPPPTTINNKDAEMEAVEIIQVEVHGVTEEKTLNINSYHLSNFDLKK
jgi:hypothetical protein